MARALRLAGCTLAVLILVGCPTFVHVPVGQVTSPGVVIEAEDHSFLIREGEPFATPFWVDAGSLACGPSGRDLSFDDVQMALEAGGRRVVVHAPNRQQPLYGVLMFCTVWAEGNPPEATRWYRVEIPHIEVPPAHASARSLVFSRARWVSPSEVPGQVSWALWLSETPI